MDLSRWSDRWRLLVAAGVLGMLVATLPEYSPAFAWLGIALGLLVALKALLPSVWWLDVAGNVAISLGLLVVGFRMLAQAAGSWWPLPLALALYAGVGLWPLLHPASSRRLDAQHPFALRAVAIATVVVLWIVRWLANEMPGLFDAALGVVLTIGAALFIRATVAERLPASDAP